MPAATWGRLYVLDLGFPALEVPRELILADGTDDPLADAAIQAGWPEVRFERPGGDWDLIEGELMTFADPGRDLPPIDRLEGFRPGRQCLYDRALVRVKYGLGPIAAWAYERTGLRGRGVRCSAWPHVNLDALAARPTR